MNTQTMVLDLPTELIAAIIDRLSIPASLVFARTSRKTRALVTLFAGPTIAGIHSKQIYKNLRLYAKALANPARSTKIHKYTSVDVLTAALRRSVVYFVDANHFLLNHDVKVAGSTYAYALLACPTFNPSTKDSVVLHYACHRGLVDIVTGLLSDARIDPATHSNRAFIWAADANKLDVLKLLLSDDRVDPTANANHAMKKAVTDGNVPLLAVLLHDGRCDPAGDDNQLLKTACMCGNLQVLRMLMDDERVDASADHNFALKVARTRGMSAVVEMLVGDCKVDAEKSRWLTSVQGS